MLITHINQFINLIHIMNLNSISFTSLLQETELQNNNMDLRTKV
jgi:hypothetical protein